MLNYIKGDVLDTNRSIIAHSCNNSGGYGSGVAGTIARSIGLDTIKMDSGFGGFGCRSSLRNSRCILYQLIGA